MGASQRRVDTDSRRKVGRQTQFDVSIFVFYRDDGGSLLSLANSFVSSHCFLFLHFRESNCGSRGISRIYPPAV